jgi:superfamily II DNA or RNA helicase
MFYKPSYSRDLLAGWIQELLDSITPPSNDRPALDVLTSSEILDLTYIDSAELSTAISANALFPAYTEQEESRKGYGATSAFEIIFPVQTEGSPWKVEITLQGGQPSMLGIWKGKAFRKDKLGIDLPDIMVNPVINGTQYELKESQGNRLQRLAGPLFPIQEPFPIEITEPAGKISKPLTLVAADEIYAYLDDRGNLHHQISNGSLVPLEKVPQESNYYYLRNRRLPSQYELDLSWQSQGAGVFRLIFALRNITNPNKSVTLTDELLSTLILPHIQINLINAHALFPAQQYAEAKQQFFNLSEAERQEESKRRLYQVSQSGCIATINPQNSSQITLTTFGVFDIPREIPTDGPLISEITSDPDSLLAEMPNHSEKTRDFVFQHWNLIQAILLASASAFDIQRLRAFQWEAISTGIELQATGRQKVTTIVRAPTSAGKTIVFMINAALSSLCQESRSTSVLLFPTRLLNEDMFRRLILFVYHLRQKISKNAPTGGILMGTSDALYSVLLKPEIGEIMYHYGECPACQKGALVAQEITAPIPRIIPTCNRCGHQIDYMYNSYEITNYLPDLVIATPDKLFHEATASNFETYRYPLFGAPSVRCDHCNRVLPDYTLQLKPLKRQCNKNKFQKKQNSCPGKFESESFVKPIKYIGFDEVHSLYGETATYLSVFLSTLEGLQRGLTNSKELFIRYEAATATIANETELLQALTRREDSKGEILAIPSNDRLQESFTINVKATRQRIMITLPSKISTRDAFNRAVLNSYIQLRHLTNSKLQNQLKIADNPHAWDFILGYVFKKQDGLDFQRALRDLFRNPFGENLKIDFLSGEAPKNQISRILQKALNKELDILLANLVVSLGIDIHGLNHMFMFGVPRGFTEFVQTAGRTGRGNNPGHVSILLVPHATRDTYLYRHFHAILTDVSGYYDVLPVQSSNLYCSEEIFGNVAKTFLSAACMKYGEWTNRKGINEVKKKVQIEKPIIGALCNIPELQHETAKLVRRKYNQLNDEITSQGKFLSNLMRESQQNWLIYSLRGRSGNTIKVSCKDQLLLELLSKDLGIEEADESVEEENE